VTVGGDHRPGPAAQPTTARSTQWQLITARNTENRQADERPAQNHRPPRRLGGGVKPTDAIVNCFQFLTHAHQSAPMLLILAPDVVSFDKVSPASL
jgi:hypothetical protein